MDSEDEEDEEKAKVPKFPITMFISEGMKYLRCHLYDKAIAFFNIALERDPSNKKSLLGRGKSYLLQAKYSEAKEDAEAVLKLYPKSCEAKALKGEAEYFLGDFERGFLTFHRGYDARPNFEALKLGHQMCRKAIDNALCPDIPLVIDDQDIKSIEIPGREEEDIEKLSSQPSRSQLYEDDIKYIKGLLSDDYVTSVHENCHQLLDYLKDRQTFWRIHKPNLQIRNTFPLSEVKDNESSGTSSSAGKLKEETAAIEKMSNDLGEETGAKTVEATNSQENFVDEKKSPNAGPSKT